MPSADELRELEVYEPCTMCGAFGVLPDSEARARARGAKWFPWMDPKVREDRTCNACSGSKQALVSQPGEYEWSVENWGTKWDASFSEPFVALGGDDAVDVGLSTSALGVIQVPTVAVYKFDTAWSQPEPFVLKASELYPELEFELRYAEMGMDFAGCVTYVSGLLISYENLSVEDVLAPEERWF